MQLHIYCHDTLQLLCSHVANSQPATCTNFTINVQLHISATQLIGILTPLLHFQVGESNGRPVENARAFCETKGTPFYRLSPKLDMAVDLDEQNTETLLDMVTTARRYIMEQTDQLLDIKKHTVFSEVQLCTYVASYLYLMAILHAPLFLLALDFPTQKLQYTYVNT